MCAKFHAFITKCTIILLISSTADPWRWRSSISPFTIGPVRNRVMWMGLVICPSRSLILKAKKPPFWCRRFLPGKQPSKQTRSSTGSSMRGWGGRGGGGVTPSGSSCGAAFYLNWRHKKMPQGSPIMYTVPGWH